MSIPYRGSLLLLCLIAASGSAEIDWAGSVTLPEGEEPVRLFNGEDLTGWQPREDDFFSVHNGMIRAANEGRVPKSTYLFTEKSYRNFRLLLEVKQTRGEGYSKMHSAVAALGETKPEGDDPYGFKGPLLMFCHDWGIWDAYGRNRVFPAGHRGTYYNTQIEKIGEWNRVEFLVVGNRIRGASNGRLFMDYTEQDPERLRESPLGLQLHGNAEPQEYHFRGLLLVEDPKDELATVNE